MLSEWQPRNAFPAYLELEQLHISVERINAVEGHILVKVDSVRRRKLQRVHFEAIGVQVPCEVRLCDHCLRELAERIFVRYLESRALVDRCTLVLGIERRKCDCPEGNFTPVDLP